MFVAIYNNKEFTERNSIRDLFNLPGQYKVYSISDGGIMHWKDRNTKQALKINNFEVTKFRHLLLSSEIEIFDHGTNKIHPLSTKSGKLVSIITELINDLEKASKYPSLEAYLEIDFVKDENRRLKLENERLKIKLKSLVKK